MKHFKTILGVTRVVMTVLFAANIIFMVQLYGSIKQRYLDDIAQSLRRADQIEIVDRIVASGLADANDVVQLNIGLVKSEANAPDSTYSQGYRRIDRQIISEISQSLHTAYDGLTGSPDIGNMEEALRRDLNYSGYYPEFVGIAGPESAYECPADLWEVSYTVNDGLTYTAFISPLTENILREMSGVIVTSALIALVLTLAFRYLLQVISRLRTIEEMKDDFTNNMTHELKTPIAIAYAANDALLHYPAPDDSERTRKYLTAALEQLSKLAGLVENILAMSMERRRHLTLAKEKIRLKPFLSSIIEQQKLKASKPCEITLECADDATVNADPTHFSNIVGNLIDNSIKYSGATVSIKITAHSNAVSVSDNGAGIPEKALPEIFKKFYRVPQGNTAEVRGYGIGLFYVKSIVDKHGWSIDVESKPGKGSRFTIRFTKCQ